MSEKFKILRQHSKFDMYQRMFVELVNVHKKEWGVPKKNITSLLQIQEDWIKDLKSIPSSGVHDKDAVRKRNETLALFSAEIEFVMEYHLINNESVTIADKILLGISGF